MKVGWEEGMRHDSEETHKFTHSVSLDGFALHVQVPDFDREVVPRDHVTARVGELDVGDGGDYLGEEAAIRRVLGLLEHCNERDAFSTRFLLLLETIRLYEHMGLNLDHHVLSPMDLRLA